MEIHSNTHAQTSYNFDAVPRVSIDGQPHKMLVLAACLSGLIVATILVSIIVMMLRTVAQKLELHKMKDLSPQKDIEVQVQAHSTLELIQPIPSHSTNGNIFTIFRSTKKSYDLTVT